MNSQAASGLMTPVGMVKTLPPKVVQFGRPPSGYGVEVGRELLLELDEPLADLLEAFLADEERILRAEVIAEAAGESRYLFWSQARPVASHPLQRRHIGRIVRGDGLAVLVIQAAAKDMRPPSEIRRQEPDALDVAIAVDDLECLASFVQFSDAGRRLADAEFFQCRRRECQDARVRGAH